MLDEPSSSIALRELFKDEDEALLEDVGGRKWPTEKPKKEVQVYHSFFGCPGLFYPSQSRGP